MKCVIYKTEDGRALVGIVCNQAGEIISPDIDKHLDDVLARDPGLVSWRITDHLNLPGGSGDDRYDNTFSEAFTDELDGDQVDVDMPRARVIHMDRIRGERNRKLLRLDTEEGLASRGRHPNGKSVAEIQAVKNVLCDLPDTYDLEGAVTPEELKALWPDELGA